MRRDTYGRGSSPPRPDGAYGEALVTRFLTAGERPAG
jgi:hypothetical protein